MNYTCIVSLFRGKVCSFLLDEKQETREIHFDEWQDEQLRPGDIRTARVSKILWNIQGAFLDMGGGLPGYLALEDLKDPVYTHKGASDRLQEGDELLVQVTHEAIKTKAASVSANIVLKGQYALVENRTFRKSISRKITGERRKQLEELLTRQPSERGILLRTKAAAASDEQIEAELSHLMEQMDQIIKQAHSRKSGSSLYRTPVPWIERILHFDEESIREIITDSELIADEMRGCLKKEMPQLHDRIRVYHDQMVSLDKVWSFRRRIDEALSEKVFLSSGACLMIQPVEALTVIDVNTGRIGSGKGRQSAEEVFLKINLEAAREIARQIRLRNMSGIIIVDFISMSSPDSETKLLSQLRSDLSQDPVTAVLVDMTKLGLVEITRKKLERPVWETVKEWVV